MKKEQLCAAPIGGSWNAPFSRDRPEFQSRHAPCPAKDPPNTPRKLDKQPLPTTPPESSKNQSPHLTSLNRRLCTNKGEGEGTSTWTPTPIQATLDSSKAKPSRERSDPPDAEGATAPRKLSGKRTAKAYNFWREAFRERSSKKTSADGITISGKQTEGAHPAGESRSFKTRRLRKVCAT